MTLQRYAAKRILLAVPTMIGVSLLTFLLVKLLPGDAVTYLAGFSDISQSALDQLRADYNLDEPIWTQYVLWVRDAMVLDFGVSLTSERAVGPLVVSRLLPTVALGLLSLLVAVAVGIPAGILAAVQRGKTADEVSRIAALLGIATPNFWLGLILLLVFSVHLGWFSAIPPTDSPLWSPEMVKFMILPAIALGTASAALIMRIVRSSMIEELNRDYVRTARSKGLKERTVVLKHVTRNSLISAVTVLALQVALLLNGAVVIEEVFSWPGIGRLLIDAVYQRNVPVIQAIVLVIALIVVAANLLADLLYAYLDPRIRY